MSRRTIILWLSLFSTMAFAARLGTAVYLKAWQRPNAMEHKSIAMSLVKGTGFSFGDWGYFGPTSVQSPPFPFLLAGLYEIFGTESPADGSLHGANRAYLAIFVINSLAGAALVWLTYSMTTTLGGTPLAGLLATGAAALWPSQVYAARHVQAISIITCGVVAGVILFYRGMRSERVRPWLGYSIVFSITSLVEPVFLPTLAISAALPLVWPGLRRSIRFRNAAICALAALGILGPWTLRNRMVHGRWVPVKETFWVNMWKGNNQYATGTDRLPPTSEELSRAKKNPWSDSDVVESPLDRERQYSMLGPSQVHQLRNQQEPMREQVFKNFTMSWIKAHPDRYIHLCWVRLGKTLTIDWDNPKSYNWAYIISRYLLLGITVLGLIAAWRAGWSLVFVVILCGTALITYTLTVTAARFSMPFEPVQLSLASAFFAWLFQGRSQDSAASVGMETAPLPTSAAFGR